MIELRDGRELAWTEAGDPAGAPVLGFHGTPGSRHQLLVDEGADGATGLEQCGDLAGWKIGQRRETDHRGAKHVGRGDQISFAVQHPDVGGHAAIMSCETASGCLTRV